MGLRQKDVAEFIGKSPACVRDWERGRTEPSADELKILADFFNVPIDYFLERDIKNYQQDASPLLGETIKSLRLNNSLTAKELALKLNVSTSLIYEWEHNRCEPSISALNSLSEIFDCSIDYLVGRDSDVRVISKGGNLTKNESEILRIFTMLDEVQQNRVIGYGYAYALAR